MADLAEDLPSLTAEQSGFGCGVTINGPHPECLRVLVHTGTDMLESLSHGKYQYVK
jgi:hypothetical protein